MGLNMFSEYLNNVMADRPCRPQWAKAHRAYVASPTTVLIWVNTRNKKQIWHHHDNSICNMSIFSVANVWIIVLENLWITFVAYSARWHGVSFCYIKTGRSNMWAWIEVILLWRLKGVALNLLRPRGNKIKSLGFYGGGVLQTLRRSMYCTHDLNMLKLLYRRCAILTSSSNPPKWTLQLLWDCVFCVVGGFPFSSSPSLSFFAFCCW